MRLWCGVLLGLFLTACSSEYEGESFPRVVRASEVAVVDELPHGTRVIGIASHLEEPRSTATAAPSARCGVTSTTDSSAA